VSLLWLYGVITVLAFEHAIGELYPMSVPHVLPLTIGGPPLHLDSSYYETTASLADLAPFPHVDAFRDSLE